jgi:ubiquinone/menaquinone biosynthesis C-methylase UbiE
MTQPSQVDEESKRQIQQYWNDRAKTYDSDGISEIQSEKQREAWWSLLQKWIGEDQLTALDLGCGTGVISLLLAELGHDVLGIDLSSEMLDRARKKARSANLSIEFSTGDAEELLLLEDTYDLVTARWLIWTLPDPEKAIEEWKRVTRPGGRILLIEGHWDFPEPFDGYEGVHNELPLYDGHPPEELAEFLTEQGLEGVEYEPLMESAFWDQEPNYEQYIMSGDVPQ